MTQTKTAYKRIEPTYLLAVPSPLQNVMELSALTDGYMTSRTNIIPSKDMAVAENNTPIEALATYGNATHVIEVIPLYEGHDNDTIIGITPKVDGEWAIVAIGLVDDNIFVEWESEPFILVDTALDTEANSVCLEHLKSAYHALTN